MEWYLPVIWAGLIGTAVVMYVILDGFDLGIGILFPFTKTEKERDLMMNSVAPFWDGNETWLILGGAGLFVAFPKAYAIIMPALYLPVIVMLLALIFRGVSFEFRWIAKSSKKYWNLAFAGGSTLAAFSQGVILGGLIQGINVKNGVFAGGGFDWLTPFSLLCGLCVVGGYALLGATWLLIRTDGTVNKRSRQQAKWLLLAVLAGMAVVSLWTPLQFDRIAARWFTTPNIYYLWPVPVLAGALSLMLWKWLNDGADVRPFLASIGLFLLGYFGLVISNYPYLVPPSLTVWDTAAVPAAQIFMLLGTLVLLPINLAYTGLVYWVFWGKLKEGEGYH
jgi:cytochrome bd ubiquinol oxidase subunit II